MGGGGRGGGKARAGTGGAACAGVAGRGRRRPASIGADLSGGVMEVARQTVLRQGPEHIISFCKEDCCALSFGTGTFDAATVAYGARNFADLDGALAELCRVLKPGGHLLIVELSYPRNRVVRQLFNIYARWVMPTIGRLVSNDSSAYTYLPATMAAFPQGEVMEGILRKAGFAEVRFTRFTFGISTMYVATK